MLSCGGGWDPFPQLHPLDGRSAFGSIVYRLALVLLPIGQMPDILLPTAVVFLVTSL